MKVSERLINKRLQCVVDERKVRTQNYNAIMHYKLFNKLKKESEEIPRQIKKTKYGYVFQDITIYRTEDIEEEVIEFF